MTAAVSDLSRINDFGVQQSPCGYCGSQQDTSVSHGMVAQKISAEDYQDLIDLGWRRSGTYFYKPDQCKTCCPPYTIRMSANQFTPDKGQVRMLKKLAKYLSGQGAPIRLKDPTTTTTTINTTNITTAAATTAAAAATKAVGETQAGNDSLSTQAQGNGTWKHTHDWQQTLREALCIVIAAAIQVLQAVGTLPQQIPIPTITVTPSTGGRRKRPASSQQQPQPHHDTASSTTTTPADNTHTQPGTGTIPHPPAHTHTRIELASPCCLALATSLTRTTAVSQPPIPAPTLATHLADAVRDILSDPNTTDTHTSNNQTLSTTQERAAAVAAASAQLRTNLASMYPKLLSATHTAAAPSHTISNTSPNAHEGAAVTAGTPSTPPAPPAPTNPADQLLQLLSSCHVEASGGYLNFQCALVTPLGALQDGSSCSSPRLSSKQSFQNKKRLAQQRHLPHHTEDHQPSLTACSTQCELTAAPAACPQTTATQQGLDSPRGGDEHVKGGSRLEVTLLPSRFVEEEYELYRRYQISQHGDDPEDVTREGYTRFLVESPITRVPPAKRPPPPPGAPPAPAQRISVTPEQVLQAAATAATTTTEANTSTSSSNGSHTAHVQHAGALTGTSPNGLARPPPPSGYGSFHMQYRLDGVLVAVGVVDILPRCLSGVYLFWDPDVRSLGLGKLSALYELLWVQQASKFCPDLKWYYMGFYIHTCHKMRYKAEYTPSDLLCPHHKVWVRITPSVLQAIDKARVCPISTLPGASVYRNHAHTDLEAQAAAVAIGLHFISGSDELSRMVSGRATDNNGGGQKPVGQAGRPTYGVGHAVLVKKDKGRKVASGLDKSVGLTPADVFVLLWSKVGRWKVLRLEVAAAGVRMINARIEAWLQIVGSGLGQRVIYCLE